MTQQKNKGGRPGKYDEKTMPQLAKWMRRSGLTDEQIADELNIATATLYNWRNKYPEFMEALNESRDFVDSLVEGSLLKRAMGFEYEEVKAIGKKLKDGKTDVTRVEKTKKIVVPDTTACIFWLKNRKPSDWREKQEIEASTDIITILQTLAEKLPN